MDQQAILDQIVGPDSSDEHSTIRAVFVSTINGSTTINHRSEELGNDIDSQLFLALRDWADVVLVGSGTVRAENYSGVYPTETSPTPARMAVITRSMDFAPEARLFSEYHVPHIFLVPHACLTDPDRATPKDQLAQYGDIVDTHQGSVSDCVAALKELGFRRIVCEGGPTVLSALIDSDEIDQFYLTVDPTLVSSVETPLTTSSKPPVPRAMDLESVYSSDDGSVFLRYRRDRNGSSN